MAKGFAGQPDRLRDAANEQLGDLINDLEDSKRRILAAREYSSMAFHGEGPIFSAITDYWADAQYYLVRVLDDNIENIGLDRQALREIADRYDADDESAARGMPS